MPRRKGRHIIPFSLPEESAEEALRRRLSPRGKEIDLTQRLTQHRWPTEDPPLHDATPNKPMRGIAATINAWLAGKPQWGGYFITDGQYIYSYRTTLARRYPSGKIYVIDKPDSGPATTKHYNAILANLKQHGFAHKFVHKAADFPLNGEE